MSAINAVRTTPRIVVIASVSSQSPSKTWDARKRNLAGMHMQAAEFGAAMQLGKHLAGVEQALRIEGALQPLLLIEIGLGEHHGHQIAFLDADAVLAGQHAPDLDAELEDFRAELLGLFQFARRVGVV